MAGVSLEGDVHGLEMALQTGFVMRPLTDILLLILAEMVFPDGSKDVPLDPAAESILTVNGKPVNIDLFIHRCAKKMRLYVENGRDTIKDSIDKIQKMRELHRDLHLFPPSARESEDEDSEEPVPSKTPELNNESASQHQHPQRPSMGKLEPSSVLEVVKHFIMLLKVIDEPEIKNQIRGLTEVARTLTDKYPGIGSISTPPETLSGIDNAPEKRPVTKKRKVASIPVETDQEKVAKKGKPSPADADTDGLEILQTPVPLIEKRKASHSKPKMGASESPGSGARH